MELSFFTYTGAGKAKRKVLEDFADVVGADRRDEDGELTCVSIKDVELHVRMEKDDVVEEDISCDSSFMVKVVPEIAQAMRRKYHWVPREEKLYLVMDNAGGHGTKEAIQEYVSVLKESNIQVIWQVPRSPETNMLDLGVWMSIQTSVTKVHQMKRCNHDALARSVVNAWEHYLNKEAFINVHARLRVVLVCIVDGKGSNDLVESKRGKLFRDATLDFEQPMEADLQSSCDDNKMFEDCISNTDSLEGPQTSV